MIPTDPPPEDFEEREEWRMSLHNACLENLLQALVEASHMRDPAACASYAAAVRDLTSTTGWLPIDRPDLYPSARGREAT
jgi:hypothetical protein